MKSSILLLRSPSRLDQPQRVYYDPFKTERYVTGSPSNGNRNYLQVGKERSQP